MTKKPIYETVGVAIRELREAKGITLRGLARKLGVSPPYLSDVEHDRRSFSRWDDLAKILKVGKKKINRIRALPRIQKVQQWIKDNPEFRSLLRDIVRSRRSNPKLRKTRS